MTNTEPWRASCGIPTFCLWSFLGHAVSLGIPLAMVGGWELSFRLLSLCLHCCTLVSVPSSLYPLLCCSFLAPRDVLTSTIWYCPVAHSNPSTPLTPHTSLPVYADLCTELRKPYSLVPQLVVTQSPLTFRCCVFSHVTIDGQIGVFLSNRLF